MRRPVLEMRGAVAGTICAISAATGPPGARRRCRGRPLRRAERNYGRHPRIVIDRSEERVASTGEASTISAAARTSAGTSARAWMATATPSAIARRTERAQRPEGHRVTDVVTEQEHALRAPAPRRAVTSARPWPRRRTAAARARAGPRSAPGRRSGSSASTAPRTRADGRGQIWRRPVVEGHGRRFALDDQTTARGTSRGTSASRRSDVGIASMRRLVRNCPAAPAGRGAARCRAPCRDCPGTSPLRHGPERPRRPRIRPLSTTTCTSGSPARARSARRPRGRICAPHGSSTMRLSVPSNRLRSATAVLQMRFAVASTAARTVTGAVTGPAWASRGAWRVRRDSEDRLWRRPSAWQRPPGRRLRIPECRAARRRPRRLRRAILVNAHRQMNF